MNLTLLVAILTLFSPLTFAQSKIDAAKDYSNEKMTEAREALDALPSQRSAKPYTVSVDAALFETWVITKYGLTFTYNDSPENAYELEYLKGGLGFGYFGVNLGSIEEQKLTALWRSYSARNTFSFFTGMSYNIFRVHLGSEYLETVTGSQRANVDVAEIQTLGLTWGFGQRWHMKNGGVWGVDWFNIMIPLVLLREDTPFQQVSNSPSKREEFSDAAKLFKRVPSLGVLKLQIGYSF